MRVNSGSASSKSPLLVRWSTWGSAGMELRRNAWESRSASSRLARSASRSNVSRREAPSALRPIPLMRHASCAINRSKSPPPRWLSPATALMPTTLSKQSTTETSSVPPPKSNTQKVSSGGYPSAAAAATAPSLEK